MRQPPWIQRAVANLNVPTSDKQYLPLQWRRQFLACLDAVVSAVLKTPLTLREVLDAERNERELARATEAEFVASFEIFSEAVPKKLQDALFGAIELLNVDSRAGLWSQISLTPLWPCCAAARLLLTQLRLSGHLTLSAMCACSLSDPKRMRCVICCSVSLSCCPLQR